MWRKSSRLLQRVAFFNFVLLVDFNSRTFNNYTFYLSIVASAISRFLISPPLEIRFLLNVNFVLLVDFISTTSLWQAVNLDLHRYVRLTRSSYGKCSVKKVVLKNFANFTRKQLCLTWRSATLLKSSSNTDFFLWNLRNF